MLRHCLYIQIRQASTGPSQLSGPFAPRPAFGEATCGNPNPPLYQGRTPSHCKVPKSRPYEVGEGSHPADQGPDKRRSESWKTTANTLPIRSIADSTAPSKEILPRAALPQSGAEIGRVKKDHFEDFTKKVSPSCSDQRHQGKVEPDRHR